MVAAAGGLRVKVAGRVRSKLLLQLQRPPIEHLTIKHLKEKWRIFKSDSGKIVHSAGIFSLKVDLAAADACCPSPERGKMLCRYRRGERNDDAKSFFSIGV